MAERTLEDLVSGVVVLLNERVQEPLPPVLTGILLMFVNELHSLWQQ